MARTDSTSGALRLTREYAAPPAPPVGSPIPDAIDSVRCDFMDDNDRLLEIKQLIVRYGCTSRWRSLDLRVYERRILNDLDLFMNRLIYLFVQSLRHCLTPTVFSPSLTVAFQRETQSSPVTSLSPKLRPTERRVCCRRRTSRCSIVTRTSMCCL